MSDLIERARAWADEDPDEQTRAQLLDLIERADDPDVRADLEDRFLGILAFGTAGLRGALGAGPNRMNRVVVTRAAAGLARYLKDTGATGPVVIGFDARHGSEAFARDTAEVMTGAGIAALVMPRPLPTPVLAYAIGDLGAAAGVMVTASHNPPQDNGYKVYLGDGSQIVPPADADIAARIAAVGPLATIARGDGGSVLGEDLVERYVETVTGVIAEGPRDLRVAYTPMHGVGGALATSAFERAGFTDVHVVPEQMQPDPDFPTVAFPNPEEPGAMDLALALAEQVGADIVIASDPDADRCAVGLAVADSARSGSDGWQMLRGDEVGVLLADHLLRKGKQGVYAQSIVSSSLLGKMAEAAGQPHQETLTGFKWIGRIDGLAFGYEEALGYCVDPDHVKDKDGISAALLVMEMAAAAKASGRDLRGLLDDVARRHGLYATDQLSARFTDLDEIPATVARLRENPPEHLGGLAITSIDDLAIGTPDLPPTDGLRFRLAEGARVIVRPSGTEPKVKFYLEVVVPVEDEPDGVDAARIVAAGRLDAIRGDVRAAAGL